MYQFKIKDTNGYEFVLFTDRIALLLGGKDFFSANRANIKKLLDGGVDGRIEIYDYRHGKGYPPFNFNFDRTSVSIAEYIFDKDNGAWLRGWASNGTTVTMLVK